jgi:tetratricopeptide (TPR) repeat protein
MRKLSKIVPTLAATALLACAVTGCTAKLKASYHQKRADRYYDAGKFDQAEIEYIKALRNAPQNGWAMSRIGFIYFNQGRTLAAAQVLERAKQLASTNLEVRMKLGAIYLDAGQFKAAHDEAGFVLDHNPNDALAPVLLAISAVTNEMPATRLRLQNMLQTHESAPLHVGLGALFFRQHDLKTAEVEFNRAVALDSKFCDAYSALGDLYFAQKDFKQADQAFKTAAGFAPSRPEKVLQYAQFKIQTGDTAAGKQLLQDLVKKAPDFVPGWLALAAISANEQKYDETATLLGNVLARDPQNYEGLRLQANLELSQERPAQAISILDKMAKIWPQAPQVHLQLAQARLANQEPDKAIASLNQALQLNPKYTDAILMLAEVQISTGNVGPAVASLEQLTKRQPQIVLARLLLAEGYRLQGTPDRAVQIYRELETEYPKNPQLPLLRGTALLQQKKNTEARTAFDQALKLAPDDLPVLEQLVNLDILERQYDAAQSLVQQQVEKTPKEAALQILLAKIFFARGDMKQTEAVLLKAVELQPDSEQAYVMLAQIHTSANQNQKALADLQNVLAKNPKNTDALMLMGVTCNAEKDYPRARDAYEKLLALTPNNLVVMNNLAYLYAENLGEIDKASQLARRARDLAPGDPSIADTLGWVLYKQGQYSAAVNLLRESAAKFSRVADAQYHFGLACYMLGDEEDAKAALKQVLDLNKDFPQKDECNQCLAVLAVDTKTAGSDTRTWLEKRVADQPKDSIAAQKLAAIYQKEGAADKAIAIFESAVQANPQNITALVSLAQLYESKNPQKALNFAKSAYNMAPNDPVATYTFGRLAFVTGDYKWSLNLLQLAAQAQPKNADVLFDLGQALYSVGRVPEAKVAVQNALQTGAVFSREGQATNFLAMTSLADTPAEAVAAQSQVDAILKSNPDDVPALMVKGVVCMQKADPATAVGIYENVLKHYPDFAPAQKQLAVLYSMDARNDAKAYPVAMKAREAFPGDPEVAKALGRIVYRQGNYPLAASLLMECSRTMTTDAVVFYQLGMAEYQLKSRAAAKTALQRALDLSLPVAESTEAKRILTELK